MHTHARNHDAHTHAHTHTHARAHTHTHTRARADQPHYEKDHSASETAFLKVSYNIFEFSKFCNVESRCVLLMMIGFKLCNQIELYNAYQVVHRSWLYYFQK